MRVSRILCLPSLALGWTIPTCTTSRMVSFNMQSNLVLRAAEDPSEESTESTTSVETVTDAPPPPTAAPVSNQQQDVGNTEFPIDLPSPILLSVSMVSAIASTGSLFELFGGDQVQLAPTVAIAAVGLPLSIFMLYASILKATAETEEDDKEFMRKNNKF